MLASEVLMIRPAHFGFNPETAQTNVFQRQGVASNAVGEFDHAVQTLINHGISVRVFEDRPDVATPDSVFPNNWVSFHPEGAALYPMMAKTRRAERRLDILAALGKEVILDFTHFEADDRFLEGTGSLVLSRAERFAFACVSSRTDRMLAFQWCQRMGYRLIDFDTEGPGGIPVYHSNVVGTVGLSFAVVCREVIVDKSLLEVFEAIEEYEVIPISIEQMTQFCGNILQLSGTKGEVIAMSQTAFDAFSPQQRKLLSQHGELAVAAIPTIERLGGGSMRCMIAEIF